MSWLARSLASSFRATDEEHDDEDREEEEDEEEENIRQGRGMKEDLSELTKSFTKQLWGVASFLAPPPATSTHNRNPSFRDSSAPVSNPDQDPFSEGNLQHLEPLDRMENWSSGSSTENAQGLTGIRSDFAEIGGSVKTGLSRFSSNKAVHGISKLASTFFPFRRESDGEEFQEEGSGAFEEESGALEEEDSLKSAVGITEEVLAFARNISMHPETWLDFPLFYDEDDLDDFSLSDIQKEHALAIERLAPRLAALRIELCPGYMSEGRFWKIYFVLLHSRLNKQDALLLSTPQIVEARGLLTQELQNRTKVESGNSRSDLACSEEKKTLLPQDLQKFSNQSLVSDKNVKTGSFKIVSLQSATSVAAKDFQRDDQLTAISSQKQIFSDQSCAPSEDSLFQNKTVLSGTVKLSDLKYQEEEEVDDWLEEEPVGEDAPLCTTARLGDEEDVSFSDLEDEDENVQTTTTRVSESFDSSSKSSKGWVQLNKGSNCVEECSMSYNSKEDTLRRPMNPKSDAHTLQSGEESTEQHIKKPDNGESSDWLTVDEDDVVSADSS